MLEPFNAEACKRLAAANLTAFALEAALRTTRAQSMDVLSSQANIAGWQGRWSWPAESLPEVLPHADDRRTVIGRRVVILGVGAACRRSPLPSARAR